MRRSNELLICRAILTAEPSDHKEVIDERQSCCRNPDRVTDDLCYYSDRGIFGTYLLCYDIRNDILVYEFTVNEFSEVKVDAKTGNIVGEYYWDGTIID